MAESMDMASWTRRRKAFEKAQFAYEFGEYRREKDETNPKGMDL